MKNPLLKNPSCNGHYKWTRISVIWVRCIEWKIWKNCTSKVSISAPKRVKDSHSDQHSPYSWSPIDYCVRTKCYSQTGLFSGDIEVISFLRQVDWHQVQNFCIPGCILTLLKQGNYTGTVSSWSSKKNTNRSSTMLNYVFNHLLPFMHMLGTTEQSGQAPQSTMYNSSGTMTRARQQSEQSLMSLASQVVAFHICQVCGH